MRALRSRPQAQPKPATPRITVDGKPVSEAPKLTSAGLAAEGWKDTVDPDKPFFAVMREGGTRPDKEPAGALPAGYIFRCAAKQGSGGVNVVYPKGGDGRLFWDVTPDGFDVRVLRKFPRREDALLVWPHLLARYNMYTIRLRGKFISRYGHNGTQSYVPMILRDLQNDFKIIKAWTFELTDTWRDFTFTTVLTAENRAHWLSITLALGGEEGDFLFDDLSVMMGFPQSPPPPPPTLAESIEMMNVTFDDFHAGDVTPKSLGAGIMHVVPQHPAAARRGEFGLWVEVTNAYRSECSAQLVLKPFVVPGGIRGYSLRFWSRTKSQVVGVPPKVLIQDQTDANATLQFGYVQLEPPGWRQFEFQMEVLPSRQGHVHAASICVGQSLNVYHFDEFHVFT